MAALRMLMSGCDLRISNYLNYRIHGFAGNYALMRLAKVGFSLRMLYLSGSDRLKGLEYAESWASLGLSVWRLQFVDVKIIVNSCLRI
ncbi:MAG: hypothetical protein AB8B36_07905, partial [Prochlorococcus sp.]